MRRFAPRLSFERRDGRDVPYKHGYVLLDGVTRLTEEIRSCQELFRALLPLILEDKVEADDIRNVTADARAMGLPDIVLTPRRNVA